jgi:hypothetical protein
MHPVVTQGKTFAAEQLAGTTSEVPANKPLPRAMVTPNSMLHPLY